MPASQRKPSLAFFLGVLILVGSLAFSAWWLTQPAPSLATPQQPLESLDIICSGRVDVASAVIGLEPSQPGKIVRIAVSEGQSVTAGQEILAVDSTPHQLALREADALVQASETELHLTETKAAQFPVQIEIKTKQQAALDADLQAARQKLAQLREQTTLTSSVSGADIALVEANVTKLTLASDAAKLELNALKQFDPQLEVQAARIRLESARIQRERAQQAFDQCLLRAPEDGIILRMHVTTGGQAMPGAPALPGASPPAVVFAPAGPLIIRAELEQSYLGRVHVGMAARIRDDSRADSPVWTGRVGRIAGWVAPRRSVLLEPGEMNDVRTTELVVELDPEQPPLWIGQRMQVRLVMGKMGPDRPEASSPD